MHFDIQTIITGIAGAILGIGSVVAFLGKYLPVTKKYIGIASDSLNLVESVIESVEPDADGKVTLSAEEVTRIQTIAIKLRDDFKK